MPTTFTADSALTVRPAIDAACARVAPTWPLDQFIAVNPYWGWRELPAAEVAAQIAEQVAACHSSPTTPIPAPGPLLSR